MEELITHESIESVLKNADCLYSTVEVNEALDRMAQAITEKLKDKNPLVLCVMTGAIITTGHLLTRLHFPLEIDYLHATRYAGKTFGGELHWIAKPRKSLANRTLLIVDDVLDGGITLASIVETCYQEKAAAVYTAVLVDKQREREPGVTLDVDFIGLTTENRYLFGFGLDYHDYLRNIPGIYAVKSETTEK